MVYNHDDQITETPIYKETPIDEPVETIENVQKDELEIIEEGQEPSDDQLARLRRVAEPIPLRAW